MRARNGQDSRHAFTLVYSIVVITALCALVSLGVDLGRVQVTKTELQRAADAAGRYAAAGISQGVTATEDRAIAAAAENTADGSPVALNRSADIEFGTWDASAKTFTPLTGAARSNANAMRITARRTAARGNAVPLLFAKVLGRETCDVSASSIALLTPGTPGGAVGLTGIIVRNSAFIASYNSSVTTTPTQAGANSNGGMASNGTISGQNNNLLKGTVTLGPGGDINGVAVTGGTNHVPANIPAPDMPTWSPAANPGGISQNYTVNANTTLAGGTYWFTSLTLNKNLSFSGIATLIVNGNILLDGSLTAYNRIPSNLTVYQLGSGRTFCDDKNNLDATAVIVAPGADFTAKNNFVIRGDMTFSSIDARNGFEMYYDESLSAAGRRQAYRPSRW
jgi:hypothetical protein